MKESGIQVGMTYQNKTGRSVRKVIAMGEQVRHYDIAGTISYTGVRYLQVNGKAPNVGKERVLPLKSFAIWAKKEVTTE
ncbi:hypothetical protein [Paenibacillus rubinfantis]|uniref:hypothetical protein n=1 Tax=Paenibacillus rubinfantis TaxID=1720296 RepID=UPI00073F1349|nr:hypothetical protein [Paenibacillus rubinfantis]